MAGKFLHNHQTHSYPADKMLPKTAAHVKAASNYRKNRGLEIRDITSNQRGCLKKQHAKRSRRWAKEQAKGEI